MTASFRPVRAGIRLTCRTVHRRAAHTTLQYDTRTLSSLRPERGHATVGGFRSVRARRAETKDPAVTDTEDRVFARGEVDTVPPPTTPEGNPALIGVPTFLVGSVALGLVLTGFVPAAAAGA